MYILQSLHVQLGDFHFLIFILNSSSDIASLISLGNDSQIFGPLYLTDSIP